MAMSIHKLGKARRSSYADTHLNQDLAEIPGHDAQKFLVSSRLPFADPEDVRTRPGAKTDTPTDVFVFILFGRFRQVNVKGGGVDLRAFLSLQWDTTLAGHQVVVNRLVRCGIYQNMNKQNKPDGLCVCSCFGIQPNAFCS